jgi:hypothetical protein
MRAVATAGSPEHARQAAGRARRRRDPLQRALQLTFRQASWPPWLLLDEHGQPTFDRLGMLQLDPQARYVPPAGCDSYRMVVRDAYLLAGRQLPVDVDGRALMALRYQRELPPATRRSAPTEDQRELAELARRTGEPFGLLARLSPDYRRGWLVQLRTEEVQRAQEDILASKAQLRGEA